MTQRNNIKILACLHINQHLWIILCIVYIYDIFFPLYNKPIYYFFIVKFFAESHFLWYYLIFFIYKSTAQLEQHVESIINEARINLSEKKCV